jgi:DNA repair protein RecN (Recombination protein N)
MLAGLSIRDVVLIDRLDLAFHAGLGVLTGETGAGKSILLDALGLALGMRALGESLVEIQSQLDQHGLLDGATHRAALDAYGAHLDRVTRCRAAHAGWRAAEEAKRRFEAELAAAQRDEAYLRHAAAELDRLAPEPGEEAKLASERMLLMHREQVAESLNAALALLAGEAAGTDGTARGEGIEARLGSAQRLVERAAEKAGGRLAAASAALERAAVELAEAIAGLEAFGTGVEFEPGRLETVDERLYALRDAARKHQVATDALPALRATFAERLAAIEERGDLSGRHAQAVAEGRAAYLAAAGELSTARRTAALRLDQAIGAELPPLKLEKARFTTRLEPLAEADWHADGMERVAFEVATNPGAPLGPIARIASGGELARFMLALKVVLSRVGTAPTLVFDEVDSGIGGATAAAVGERLARLGVEFQVLVVTHSPQVAARGAHHWRVAKSEGAGDKVLTSVEELALAARREEIARMLSGRMVTDEARAAAASLIDSTR